MPRGDYYIIKSIFNKMLNPVCYKDRNGVYLGVNEIFARLIAGLSKEEIIGYTLPEVAGKITERFPERSIINGKFLLERVEEENIDETELLKNGGTSTREYEGICADGVKRTFLANKSTYNDEQGKIVGLVTVLQDITEFNETEKKLEKNEETYRIVIEQTGQLVYDYDIKSGKIAWSGATREIIGYDLKDFESTDIEVWLNRVHPEERDGVWKAFERNIEKGENFRLEYRFRRTDESYIYIEENVVCLKDENGNVNRALGVIKNITERKLSQERLEMSEERYRSFIQNFNGIAFQLDENFFPEFMHGKVEEITGYIEEEFLSRRISWIGIVHPEDVRVLLTDIEKIQRYPYNLPRELDFRIIHRSGKIKWIHQTYQKIRGKDQGPDKYHGTAFDITEKRNTEEALEKIEEFRKKEIHHRVKNNLQVISSLLDLQAEKFNNRECIKDSEVMEAFRESENRVTSIALIHEELHESEGTGTLNFSLYLQKLIEGLFQIYTLGNTGVSLKMDLEKDIFLGTDTAVPLGMLVNELITNSLKYAFPGRKKGEIKVRLFSEETESELNKEKEVTENSTWYILIVSDNGTGLPEKVNLENPDTLGLQLVNVLIEQIEGEIELKRNRGTEFIIKFSTKPLISEVDCGINK